MFPLINPYRQSLQRYLWEFLKDNYPKHERTIDRCSSIVVSEPDLQELLYLFYDVYQSGYMSAANELKKELEKQGMTMTVHPGGVEK